MSSAEIIKELQFNDKWLNDDYKNSNYYHGYLDKINQTLKQ